MTSLFTLLHDKVACTSLASTLSPDEVALIQQVFSLLLDLSYVGSAVYQMLRGNILFYILLSLRSTDPSLQLQAAQLLWKITSKRCASSGSPFGQALDVRLLLQELVTVIQRTNSSDLLRLLMSIALVLSFSGDRKLQLLSLCADSSRLASAVKQSMEMPKYSAVSFYQHLVGPNRCVYGVSLTSRDSDRVLCVMKSDMLFQLAQFPDDFVRFSALSELRFRLMRLVLPPESAMPPEYEHDKVQLRCRGREQMAEAFLSPSCVYLFGSTDEKIVYELLVLKKRDTEIHFVNPQQNVDIAMIRFTEEATAEKWMSAMKSNNLDGRFDLRSMLWMIERYAYGQQRGGERDQRLLIHPLVQNLDPSEVNRLENIVGEGARNDA